MRSFWLSFGALCPAIALAAPLTSSSLDDLISGGLEASANGQSDRNSTTSENGLTLTYGSGRSNATIRIVNETQNAGLSVKPTLNDTNANYNFVSDGYTFIGRSIAGSDLRPFYPKLAAAIGDTIGDVERWPANVPITAIGPLYREGVKSSFTFVQSATWNKNQLIRALTALKRHFDGDPITQGLVMTIRGPGNLRCTFRTTNVRFETVTFQYAPRTITARSNQMTLYVYPDDSLDEDKVAIAFSQTDAWIAGRRQSSFAEPGTTHSSGVYEIELNVKVASIIPGPSADITWGDFGFAVRTAFRQSIQLNDGQTAATLAIFADYRDQNQGGLLLTKSSSTTETFS